jgi:signal transduction histidine kinase
MQRAVSLCSRTLNFVSDARPAPRREPLPMKEMLEGVIHELAPAADGAAIGAEADPALVVSADPEQLPRALVNLTLNAIQAGARTISLAAAVKNGRATIRVADDGPGLPDKAREKLFQPFAGSGRKGGVGLGLPIAREIARDHGGDLVLVESAPGRTVFELSFPAAPPQAAKAEGPAP